MPQSLQGTYGDGSVLVCETWTKDEYIEVYVCVVLVFFAGYQFIFLLSVCVLMSHCDMGLPSTRGFRILK